MNKILNRTIKFISGIPQPLLMVFCTAFVIVLGIIDFYTGYEFSFSIFYLIPIIISSWLAGRASSYALSFLSTVSWYLADINSGHDYSSPHFPVWNAFMRFAIFIFISFIIMRMKKQLQREKEISFTDLLTGSYNRRYLYDSLSLELERAKRNNSSVTLGYIDIDNFKLINDTLGHRKGDYLLASIVDIIKSNIRSIDSVSRIGGDEFVVMLTGASSENIEDVFSRIIDNLHKLLKENKWDVISLSIGVVTCRERYLSVDDFIEKADNLMYRVKKSGKNNIKFMYL